MGSVFCYIFVSCYSEKSLPNLCFIEQTVFVRWRVATSLVPSAPFDFKRGKKTHMLQVEWMLKWISLT